VDKIAITFLKTCYLETPIHFDDLVQLRRRTCLENVFLT
jgi:hypothetical protein